MSWEVNCWDMWLLKVVWSWLCDYTFGCWCNLCDTNINVSNAIKLSHFEVKDFCEPNMMHLVLLRIIWFMSI